MRGVGRGSRDSTASPESDSIDCETNCNRISIFNCEELTDRSAQTKSSSNERRPGRLLCAVRNFCVSIWRRRIVRMPSFHQVFRREASASQSARAPKMHITFVDHTKIAQAVMEFTEKRERYSKYLHWGIAFGSDFVCSKCCFDLRNRIERCVAMILWRRAWTSINAHRCCIRLGPIDCRRQIRRLLHHRTFSKQSNDWKSVAPVRSEWVSMSKKSRIPSIIEERNCQMFDGYELS